MILTPPPRLANWDAKLLAWANRLIGQPFVWGVTDCHALARDALLTMYGVGPVLPSWADRREALALCRDGWAMPEALVRIGAQPVPLGFVRRGDLVVEPITGHFHPVLVALGESRFLTSSVGELVRVVLRGEIDREATGWRFAHG